MHHSQYSVLHVVICTDSTDPDDVLKIHLSLVYLRGTPCQVEEVHLQKVLNMVNSLEGNDYTEVLTLTREEKDKQREERRKGKRQEQLT